MHTDPTSTLERLVVTLEHGRRGFAEGADKLREGGYDNLADVFDVATRERAAFARQLRAFDPGLWTEADQRGSTAGALHRVWLALREALAGDSPRGTLAAAASDEEHTMEHFASALEGNELTSDVRAVVTRQALAIKTSHESMLALHDKYGDTSRR